MALRYNKLRMERGSPELSRSFPKAGGQHFKAALQQCVKGSGSLESVSSAGYGNGRYKKLSTYPECDCCHTPKDDIVTLTCLHVVCSSCINRQGESYERCPKCARLAKRCDNCMSNSASKKCLHCRLVYCDVCLNKFHDPMYHDHDVVHVPRSRSCFVMNHSKIESGMKKVPSDSELSLKDYIDDNFNSHTRETYQQPEESFADMFYRLENYVVRELEAKIDMLYKEKEQVEIDVINESKKIQDHLTKLKSVLDQKADMMIKQMHESKTRHTLEFERQALYLKEKLNSVKATIAESRKLVETGLDENDSRTERIKNSMKTILQISDQLTEEKVHIRYSVKPINENSIETVIGRVGTRVFFKDPLQFDLVSVTQFDAGVNSICPIDSTKAWIGYQNCLQLAFKDGDKGEKVQLDEDIQDLALDHSGNVIIACQSSVKSMNEDGEVKTLFKCPSVPHGIGCRSDDLLVLSLDEGKHIRICNKNGEIISELNDGNQADLKMPYKIAVNVNGDICVSDYQSSYGDVVIFDSAGLPKARLRTDGMAPRGLACNGQGHIFVGDFRSDRVNVYSIHGHYIQTAVDADERGLSGPLSVAIDAAGDLWVGDWKRKVRIYNTRVAV